MLYGYYIMPKKEISLADYMNQNFDRIEVDKTVNVFKQLIYAIENIHSVGFTHNDIKRSNIMLDS